MNRATATISISDAERPLYFGVDVGGSSIKIGLVDDLGRTLAFRSVPTHEPQGPVAAVQRITGQLAEMVAQAGASGGEVVGLGLGAPGPMDLQTGMLLAPPQLPTWADFNIRGALAESARLPVAFTNDANAAAYGEHWLGSGAAQASLVLITLGTGVGGGVIIDGHLLGGANSFGGEFGHLLVDPADDARLCGWGGGRGQLEAYASAAAVTLRTAEWLAAGQPSSLQQIEGEVTPKEVHAAALRGDPLALRIIDEAARWLGVGLTTIVHVLDPGVVAIGGAMTFGGGDCPIGRRFLSRVVAEFRERTFDNVFAGTEIAFAKLGADAGYLGAAGLARHTTRAT